MKKTIFLVAILISANICSAQNKDREWFKQVCIKCATVDSTADDFYIQGYTYSEFKNTVIKQFKGDTLVDSFLVIPEDFVGSRSGDSVRLKFRGDFKGYIKVKSTYQFCIPGYPPHIVSNIKTYARPCGPSGYSCEIEQYDLDGITKKGHEIAIIKPITTVSN